MFFNVLYGENFTPPTLRPLCLLSVRFAVKNGKCKMDCENSRAFGGERLVLIKKC